MGPVEMYDDGASVAASRMTFMDGSVAGRVSQYGLPKYAHHPKADYRRWVGPDFMIDTDADKLRFCVQRGNADVFLD
jgi:hypothetical protein